MNEGYNYEDYLKEKRSIVAREAKPPDYYREDIIQEIQKRNIAFAVKLLEDHPDIRGIRIGGGAVEMEEKVAKEGIFRRRVIERKIRVESPEIEIIR